jgi:uncharacterized membrane protein YuzA (DUF378 family)
MFQPYALITKGNIFQDKPLTNLALFYAAAACTLIAGILHIAIVPMFFGQMTIDVMIFFIVSGLAQLFWVIPTIKRWIIPWFYIGIGGTIILIILYFIAVPGSGYPISPLHVAIETFQMVFVIVCTIIILKDTNTAKVNKKNS